MLFAKAIYWTIYIKLSKSLTHIITNKRFTLAKYTTPEYGSTVKVT